VKDQYCGDINDFRKYGILRALAGRLSLCVCWMLTPADGRTDGKHTAYLSQPRRWRDLDAELFDALGKVVATRRCVEAIEQSGLLPDAAFYSAVVPDAGVARSAWFEAALSAAHRRDLVFFDPDNGLEVKSVGYGRASSSKYLYWHEVQRAWGMGHSLVIYQHFPRRSRAEFITTLSAQLRDLCPSAEVTPLCTPYVVFFVVAQPLHLDAVRAGVDLTRRFTTGLAEKEEAQCGSAMF
jgi:hypothetical protein